MLILKFKDEVGAERKLDGGRITIGRDPGNDVVLDDDSISGFHAQILIENNTAELIDLGSTNGTCIDGEPIVGRQPLAAWQKLRFGSVEAEVQDPSGRRPTTTMSAITDDNVEAARASDSTTKAAAGQKTVPVGKKRGTLHRRGASEEFPESIDLHDSLTVGRDAACELHLTSTMVSSRHARIVWRQDHVYVEDLGSTNGTWVNGKRVQSTSIASGDRVAFDEIEYVFKPVEAPGRTGTTVNPAVDARPGGTTVRPAIDSGGDNRGSPQSAGGRSPDATADRPVADPPGTHSPSNADPGETREGPSVASEKPATPDSTRVQPAAQAPKRTPQKARPRPPAPPQQANKARNSPISRDAAPSASAASAQAAPEGPAKPEKPKKPVKPEKPQPQQVIVKQKGSGCMIAMFFIITLVVAFPLLLFVFKIGFLIVIFNEIKSFFGF